MPALNAMAQGSLKVKADSCQPNATAAPSQLKKESGRNRLKLQEQHNHHQKSVVQSAMTPVSSLLTRQVGTNDSVNVDMRQEMNESDSYPEESTLGQPGQSPQKREPKLPVYSEQEYQQAKQGLLRLIEKIKANLPCNPSSPKNQKHEQAIQRVMRKYFRGMGTAFPTKKVESFYRKWVKDE